MRKRIRGRTGLLFLGSEGRQAPFESVLNPVPFGCLGEQTTPRREIPPPYLVPEENRWPLVWSRWPVQDPGEFRRDDPNQDPSLGIAGYGWQDLRAWRSRRRPVKSSELPEKCSFKNRLRVAEIHKIGGRSPLIFTADQGLKSRLERGEGPGTAGCAFSGVADRIVIPRHVPPAAFAVTLCVHGPGRIIDVIPRGEIDLLGFALDRLEEGCAFPKEKLRRIVEEDWGDSGLPVSVGDRQGRWIGQVRNKSVRFGVASGRHRRRPGFLGSWTGTAKVDVLPRAWREPPGGKVVRGGDLSVSPLKGIA